MNAITWKPGSDTKLDLLFDSLRENQYRDRSHKLWKNYSHEEINTWSGAIAYTICFNDSNQPELCSTISSRSCWPIGAFRILNRLWKCSNHVNYPTVMSPSFAYTASSQISWLTKNVDCKLYFISRQKDNWESWVIKMFKKHYNIDFKTNDYKYLTCPNRCDITCWQKIIYWGDESILEKWQRQL